MKQVGIVPCRIWVYNVEVILMFCMMMADGVSNWEDVLGDQRLVEDAKRHRVTGLQGHATVQLDGQLSQVRPFSLP